MRTASFSCPIAWMARAAQLPGRAAVLLGLLLWTVALRCRQRRRLQLRTQWRDLLGMDRHAERRALARLEAAGLIAVERHRGRRPRITVVDVPTLENEELEKWLLKSTATL